MRTALGERLGSVVASARPVSGGDVAASYRVVFAKTHAGTPGGAFTTEAAGLAWQRDAGAVAVPEVLAVSDAPPLLALEWVDEGGSRSSSGKEARFGRQLAALHLSGAPCFGREDRRPTGSLGMANDPAATWAELYADRRLVPLADIAERRRARRRCHLPGALEHRHRLFLWSFHVIGDRKPPRERARPGTRSRCSRMLPKGAGQWEASRAATSSVPSAFNGTGCSRSTASTGRGP